VFGEVSNGLVDIGRRLVEPIPADFLLVRRRIADEENPAGTLEAIAMISPSRPGGNKGDPCF
jgi:hypothetical protein